jgi:hypothetical protein
MPEQELREQIAREIHRHIPAQVRGMGLGHDEGGIEKAVDAIIALIDPEDPTEGLPGKLTQIVARANQGLLLNGGELELIEEAARRLALLPKDEWRTMETAPRDGRLFTIYHKVWRRYRIVNWDDGPRHGEPGWSVPDGREGFILRPGSVTAWVWSGQALPAPPTLISQQEAE